MIRKEFSILTLE